MGRLKLRVKRVLTKRGVSCGCIWRTLDSLIDWNNGPGTAKTKVFKDIRYWKERCECRPQDSVSCLLFSGSFLSFISSA